MNAGEAKMDNDEALFTKRAPKSRRLNLLEIFGRHQIARRAVIHLFNSQAERKGFLLISVGGHDTKHCCPDLFWTLLASVQFHRHAMFACIEGHVSRASIMAYFEVRISDTANFSARKHPLP